MVPCAAQHHDAVIDAMQGVLTARCRGAASDRHQLLMQCRAVSRKPAVDAAGEHKSSPPTADLFQATLAALQPRVSHRS